MRIWIDAIAEIEALLSLATYSFEHPADPFPEFADAAGSLPCFLGEDLGHPLIPTAQCVREYRAARREHARPAGERLEYVRKKHVAADGWNQCGAGKCGRADSRQVAASLSAFARNAHPHQRLAAGGPLELLHGDAAHPPGIRIDERRTPLLFLFDELLEGTNSKDRRIGADGLIRALLERGAIGIVTTHDLALTEMTESLGASVRNAHFQDFVENGQMRFDYKLQEGVVAKSNALELMRLIG